MSEFAQPSSEDHLTESAKARQRAELLSLAASMPSTASSSTTAPASSAPEHTGRKRIFLYAASFAFAVLILNLVLSALPIRRNETIVARLLVPASQSAQAFSLTPNKTSIGGMDTAEGWTLHTTVPASISAIQAALTIVPATPVTISKMDDASWKIVPTQALAQNTLYHIALVTTLQNGATESPYRYSWVNQTAGTFTIESLSPGPGAVNVPTDTSIEWTFSQAGFTVNTSTIQITPAVDGRFEVHDRTLVFLPTKPLKMGQVYHVTLASGFGISDTPTMQLAQDATYAFQVTDASGAVQISQLYLPIEQEVTTQKAIELPFALNQNQTAPKLHVDAFALSEQETEMYLAARSEQYGMFVWNDLRRSSLDVLTNGKTPVFSLDKLERKSHTGDLSGLADAYISLPGQSAGFYLMRVSAPGFATDLSLVEVTDVAVNVMIDHTSGLVWALDAKTHAPIDGAAVSLGDASTSTSADGLAKLSLPEESTLASRLQESVLFVRAQYNGQVTLVRVNPQSNSWWYGGGNIGDTYEGLRRTWSYLHVDRMVQRQADTIHIFGLALDRATKKPPANLKLRIVSNVSPYYSGMVSLVSPTLDVQDVTPDAFGRYQASFTWTNRAVGSYIINLERDGRVVSSQYFSVNQEAKPRSEITLKMDRSDIFAGDLVTGIAHVAYADGTPFVHASVRIQVMQSSEPIFDQVLHTDDAGDAHIEVHSHRAKECDLTPTGEYIDGNCSHNDSIQVNALSAEGELAQTQNTYSITAHSGSLELAGSQQGWVTPQLTWSSHGVLSLSGAVNAVTLTGAGPVSTPSAGQTVNLRVYHMESVQVQTGTRYDEVEKKTVPVMMDTQKYVLESQMNAVSDASGALSASIPVQTTSSQYQVVGSLVDAQGRHISDQVWAPYRNPDTVADAGNVGGSTGAMQEPDSFTLVRTDADIAAHPEDADLTLNQRVSFSLRVNGSPILVSKYSRPLFVVASRGIIVATVSGDDHFDFTFDERAYPNAMVYAIVMTKDGFQQVTQYLALKRDPYVLTIQATTDKDAYAPGDAADVHVRVLDSKGQVVRGAKVALSTADNSLMDLGAFDNNTRPVDQVYSYVDTDIQAMVSTHQKALTLTGGAEGGGGGGDEVLFQPRKNFKDQADFVVLETDANGEASSMVKLPDNITTWRIELVALSTDLQAGNLVIQRAATKPLSVDAVIPTVLQVGDQAQLKLRPIATDLSATTEVTYAVNAPDLGIDHQVVKAKGRANVYVPMTITDKMIGAHTITVGVSANDHQDAMQFPITVEARGYTKTI